MALSLGPAIMEPNWGNGSRVCALDGRHWMYMCGVHVSKCKCHPFQIPRLSPMSRQWPPPPGRGLPSPISIEFDNSIQLVIKTNFQFVNDYNSHLIEIVPLEFIFSSFCRLI